MKPAASYEAARAQHRWRIPERFNMGVAVCDRRRQRDLALIHPRGYNDADEYTFGDNTFASRWCPAKNGSIRGDQRSSVVNGKIPLKGEITHPLL